MSAADLGPVITDVIGPIVISVTLNAFVYGFNFVQFVQYQTSPAKDSFYNQLIVCWTFLLDTAHTMTTIYMLWYYVVANFVNPQVLGSIPWPYLSTPLFIVGTSLPVQHFFAWRIKRFSRSWLLFSFLSVLSLVSTGFGMSNSIVGFTGHSANPLKTQKPLVDAWLTLATACDALIAGFLLYYLNKSRTGFRRTDNIIARLVHSTVETSAINSLICLADLIIFNSLPNTNFNLLCALPMGRVYTGTLLAMLNSRLSMREEFGTSDQSTHAMQNQHSRIDRRILAQSMMNTEVKVAVDQQIHMEMDPYVRASSRSSVKGGGGSESEQAYSMHGDVKDSSVIV